MSPTSRDSFWTTSFTTLYETRYQELCAEAVVARWQRVDLTVALLVALTASTSAVAGWALWSDAGWKIVWVIAAGLAALGSIADNVMTVPRRIKDQEELRRLFSGLRTSLETFRQELVLGLDEVQALSRYGKLRERYEDVVSRSHRDIALTYRLQNRMQDEVDEKMREQIIP